MITKKEDLIGRYALRSDKEVFELFMQKCEEFEMTWCSRAKPRDITDGDAVDCNYRYGGLAYGSETYYADRGFVKLTISDLKDDKSDDETKMKIDYELAEKIGATHWHTGSFDFYKEDCGELLAYTDGKWRQSLITPANAMLLLKPIPPKPRTNTEYVKLEFNSAWQAVRSFEEGEVFYTHFKSDGWVVVDGVQQVVPNWQADKLYRKVEKEIDERQEFVKEASKIWNRDDMHCSTDIFREMYDSGKFKFIG